MLYDFLVNLGLNLEMAEFSILWEEGIVEKFWSEKIIKELMNLAPAKVCTEETWSEGVRFVIVMRDQKMSEMIAKGNKNVYIKA